MLATLADKPFNDDKWLFEIKFDGYRIIAGIKDNEVELTSRNLNSYTGKFTTIAKELKKIKHNVVLDGEVVAVDKNNNPNFQLLQNFQKTGEGNILYYVFDILWYDGNDLENVPLIERKNFLKALIPKSNKVIYSDHIDGKGKELFKTVSKQGLEGIIGKKMQSKYYENTRTKEWLKIKTEKRQEAIICGYTAPRGSRKHFGSLILGIYKRKKLVYIGHTGTGFTEESLKEMYKLFDKLKTEKSPFDISPKTNMPVTWLKPELLCEVKFSEWTQDNIMRHPVFMGLREDKSAKEAVIEK